MQIQLINGNPYLSSIRIFPISTHFLYDSKKDKIVYDAECYLELINGNPYLSVNFKFSSVHVIHCLCVQRTELVVEKLTNDAALSYTFGAQEHNSVVGLACRQIAAGIAAAVAAVSGVTRSLDHQKIRLEISFQELCFNLFDENYELLNMIIILT